MQFYNRITDQTLLCLPWQEALKAGDHYVIKSHLIGVQIPDPVNAQALVEVLVYGQILDDRNCEPGFFNVIEYSVMCPNGEESEMCIFDVTHAISRDEFEAARREGWIV